MRCAKEDMEIAHPVALGTRKALGGTGWGGEFPSEVFQGVASTRRRRCRRMRALVGSDRIHRSDPVGCKLVDGQLSFSGTRRGPRTWPADQVTAPSSVKLGIRLSHSSSATFSSMRARLDPMQR